MFFKFQKSVGLIFFFKVKYAVKHMLPICVVLKALKKIGVCGLLCFLLQLEPKRFTNDEQALLHSLFRAIL